MDNEAKILSALDAIDPALLDYADWLKVGMALKAEGFSMEVWQDWSSRDIARFNPSEFPARWASFNSSGVTGGTIIEMAKRTGWSYVKQLSWDSPLLASYEETLAQHQPEEEEPWQMALKYLEVMFDPEETIGYVLSSTYKEDKNKYVPNGKGCYRKVKDLIKDLKKYKTLKDSFGTINPDAGAWIRINPTTGPLNGDVTRWDYALAESDNMSVEEQKKLLVSLNLPIVALVESGGKSIHAIVRVDAKDEREYKQRVEFLFDKLNQSSFVVDQANKNSSRLSRLPGAVRNGKIQRLLATNIGCSSWNDWIDFLEGIDDDLPALVTFAAQRKDPPKLSEELIANILRVGNKMIITGDSKSGKTCLSQELAVCLAEGKPWINKFQCKQGKILYINLEVQEASLYERFNRIYSANKWKVTRKGEENIVIWNLRGHAVPLDKLASKIIRRCRNQGPFVAIIVDPLYKVQQGDENSAEAITSFCNALDKIAQETGAAVIYDHHHPKGFMGERKAIDRGAGSGVFARDADAIIDLSMLEPSADLKEFLTEHLDNGEKPLLMTFVLRDFKDADPLPLWFKFPVHQEDDTGMLTGAPVEGSREANLQKSSNYSLPSKRKKDLDEAFEVCVTDKGKAKISTIAKFLNKDAKTIKRWIDEFEDEYERNDAGYLWKKE